MSSVRIIKGREVLFQQTKGIRYIVPPLSEPVVNTDDELKAEDLDLSKELDRVFAEDDPQLLPSEDNTIVDIINGLFVGSTDKEECNKDIIFNISLTDIVDDEWSKP